MIFKNKPYVLRQKLGDDDNADLPPLMSINVESKQILQTTVSNAALKVRYKLEELVLPVNIY